MYMAVTDRFPAVSTVRIRDALDQLEDYLRKLSEGISVASLLTIVAGLLVLAGAITAGTRARVYDATILKVQGAGRPRIAAVHALEFGLLGLITAALALLAGTLAAWGICHFILQIGFLFDIEAALADGGGRRGGRAAVRPDRSGGGAGGAAGAGPPCGLKATLCGPSRLWGRRRAISPA